MIQKEFEARGEIDNGAVVFETILEITPIERHSAIT